MSKENRQGNVRRYLRRSHFWGRNLSILIIFTLSSVLHPVSLPLLASSPASKTDATTGGHLGLPAAPAIDLRSAADAHVTPIGSYKTSIPIDLPQAPNTPSLALNYDSAMGLGIAGVGWDLSVGWPSLISRDTRFGTPTWDYSSPWTWGGSSLVQDKCLQPGNCSYRTAPDSLSIIEINQITTTAAATVTLPTGIQIAYEAIHYDGLKRPSEPAGALTDVFAFLLKSVRDPNGYLTCFFNHQWDDTKTGRAPILEQIWYGRNLKDCNTTNSLRPTYFQRIVFETIDPTLDPKDPTQLYYFAPVSYRFGVPVSFNNLLTKIKIYPVGWNETEAYTSYLLNYEKPADSETRQPRLSSISQRSWSNGKMQEHVIRQFTYGNRNTQFNPTPILLELNRDAIEMPPSLSGSVTRPIRLPQLIGNPNGIFQSGKDQVEDSAPAAAALTKQWTMADINGDGLLDTLVADEKGSGKLPGWEGPWSTYETNGNPYARPPEQWVFLNQGTAGNKQFTSNKILLDTSAISLTATYPPTSTIAVDPTRANTNWIWQEGRGQTRIGMPQSVTSPEVYQGGGCPPIVLDGDTRMWPYLPDNARLNSGKSFEDNLVEKLTMGAPEIDVMRETLKRLESGFVPRSTVSAQLSGWMDLNRDGLPDWVVTPAMIESFDLPAKCTNITTIGNPPIPLNPFDLQDPLAMYFPRPPHPGANKPTFSSTPWYVAPGSADGLAAEDGTAQFQAQPVNGPPGPIGQPLSFSVDWSQSDFFGLTIPVGSAIKSLPSLMQGPKSPWFWMALGDLTVQTITPRSQAGTSFNLDINTGSATQSMANSTIRNVKSGQSDFTAAAGDAIMSSVDLNLDVTLLSGGNVGRSQNRAEMMDWNADGCPDYLLYDSVGYTAGASATQKPGGLLLYQGNCKGGFLPPVRINDGFDTQNDQLALTVRQYAEQVGKDIVIGTDTFNVVQARVACEIDLTRLAGCIPLVTMGVDAFSGINQLIKTAQPFLDNDPDVLPSEQRLISDAKAISTFLPVSLGVHLVDPASPARIAASIVEARRLNDEIANIVTLIAFRSRINVMSKGESRTTMQLINQTGKSIMVQTAGLVDLNGDGLPDYVITQDAHKTCGSDEWEVYWGTGTSNLAAGRGFLPEKDCIKVPPPPPDVAAVFPGEIPIEKTSGYATLPMQADFTAHVGTGIPDPTKNITTSLTTFSYISLLDYNQDGRPDLVLAQKDGQWKPDIQPNNIWTVYLNSGHGFALARPITVPGLSLANANLPEGVIGAKDAEYPGIKSGYSEAPIATGQRRSGSSVDIAFLDVNADGTADIAQRVRYHPASFGTGNDEAAILYWSRAGTGPQDLLIEELEPLTGAQTLVNYTPAPDFQWLDGKPDGNAPAGGHRVALGTTAFLVRSVTVKPFAGRSTRATAIGYDYKDPYFDSNDRAFRGFGRITVTPLDPVNGSRLDTASSIVIYQSQQSGGRGGETQDRVVDGDGIPVSETLYGYTDTQTIRGNPSPSWTTDVITTYFSARNDMISVEFPPTWSASLDLGFDGHWPLLNRASRSNLSIDVSPNITFDDKAATGGALHLDGISQRIALTGQQPDLRLPKLTVEAWVKPTAGLGTGRKVIFQYPDRYELYLDSGKVGFAVNVGSNSAPQWERVTANPVSVDAWSHVAASYDGLNLRVYVNGRQDGLLPAAGSISYPTTSLIGPRIGCGLDSTGMDIDCFGGELGELRIYPSAWQSPPRITESRTTYRMDQSYSDFGLPLETMNFGDISDTTDDVYESTTYATPGPGSRVYTAVATRDLYGAKIPSCPPSFSVYPKKANKPP